MRKRTKVFIALAVLAIIAVGIFLLVYFLNRDTSIYRIVAVSNQNTLSTPLSELSNSSMQLHPSGAFTIEIIHTDAVLFIGTGRFDRSRNQITFNFDNTFPTIWEATKTFVISSNRIAFEITINNHVQRFYFAN